MYNEYIRPILTSLECLQLSKVLADRENLHKHKTRARGKKGRDIKLHDPEEERKDESMRKESEFDKLISCKCNCITLGGGKKEREHLMTH